MCSAMYSCQSLLVILHKLRNAQTIGKISTCSYLFSNHDDLNSDNAERLCDEIQTAIESLRWTLQSEVAFEGAKGMADEVNNAYMAAFGGTTVNDH